MQLEKENGFAKGGDSILSVERQIKILREVQARGIVRIAQLQKALDVSESTIRRDLEELEKQGRIKRVHGGAVLPERMGDEPSNIDKSKLFAKEKEAIGRLAATLVDKGSSLLIDAGTTTAALARHLQAESLRIITNGMNIAEILRNKRYNVIVTGGMLKANTEALVGELTLETLKQFHVDLCFLGMNGLSQEKGLTTPDPQEAFVKQAMIRSARQVVLLLDSSKLGKVTMTHVADVNEIDLLITDDGIGDEERAWLEEQQVELLIAGRE